MSINQIQESDTYPLWRDWLNSRVQNLNIASRLNLDIDLAEPGDILVLQAGNVIGWEPSTTVLTLALDRMMTTPTAYNFIVGADTPIPLSPVPVIASANITVNINGELVVNDPGIYMFFVNFNANVETSTQNPSLSLQRWDNAQGRFINDGEGLGISASVPVSGTNVAMQTLSAAWPVIVLSLEPLNNRFRIIGSNPGSSSCQLNNILSSFTVVRIS